MHHHTSFPFLPTELTLTHPTHPQASSPILRTCCFNTKDFFMILSVGFLMIVSHEKQVESRHCLGMCSAILTYTHSHKYVKTCAYVIEYVDRLVNSRDYKRWFKWITQSKESEIKRGREKERKRDTETDRQADIQRQVDKQEDRAKWDRNPWEIRVGERYRIVSLWSLWYMATWR